MPSTWFRLFCAFLAVLACAPSLRAQRWQVQYFYDKSGSELEIRDFQFVSASRGVAVGEIEEKTHRRSVEVITADGGAHWDMLPLHEPPVSLFFLNENLGWLVTSKSIWVTTEAGRSWRKLEKSPEGVLRVYFLDEKNGFAVGIRKLAMATHDGGEHWAPITEAADQPGDVHYSAYSWIMFATPLMGIVTGWNMPPDPTAPKRPDWMDPEATFKHRERPHLALSIQTSDGGKTWKPSSSSTFGTITRVRFAAPGAGVGVGLVQYSEAFEFPSEVFRIGPDGRSETIYRDKKIAVTDVWLAPDGTAYLAGALHASPIRDILPGKIQVFKGQARTAKFGDPEAWTPMEVDYRAVAKGALLAEDGGQMWMATEAGMILKLVP